MRNVSSSSIILELNVSCIARDLIDHLRTLGRTLGVSEVKCPNISDPGFDLL